MIGVAVTVALFALFWALRGKLNTMGMEYIRWNPTPSVAIVRAIILGTVAGAAISWWFRGYDVGTPPPFADLWIAVTWGPLIEEVLFRGYLFSLLAMLLGRWMPKPGWFVVILVAVLFAAGHLVKGGITPVQLASVFLTGTLYGWLRLDSDSTVPAVCSHISYNSVIYFAAAFLRLHK
jgi:membrane protease YdiL (CAAX protease family)